MQQPRQQTTPSRALRSRPARLAASACLALLLFGCALPGGPRALERKSERAAAEHDYETAYRTLKQIAVDHPESSEAERVFPDAAGYFKAFYHYYRFREPGSAWITSEPAFMFGWLARYFDEDPTEKANALFRGCPMNVFREFEAFAMGRPELSRWTLRAEDDNGIITSVSASPAEAAGAAIP